MKSAIRISNRYRASCHGIVTAASLSMVLTMMIGSSALAQQLPGVQTPADQDISQPRLLEYQLNVSPRVTMSDNANLDPEFTAEGDTLASVRLDGGMLIDRMKFSGLVSGTIELGSYLDVPTDFDPFSGSFQERYDNFVVDQDVQAAATAEFVDDLVYLDMSAAAQQRALNDSGAFSTTSIAASQQEAKIFSYSVSPYVFRKLINGSEIEARYRYTSIGIDDSNAAANTDNFLNDSQSHELLAEYSSGRLYDRLGFSLRGYATNTKETGSDVLPEVDFEQRAVSGDIRYPFSRKLSATATIGYDNIDTNGNQFFDDDAMTGIFWKAGLLATPGRRTRAQIEVGNRYDGTWVEADAAYRYSSRLQFQGSISRSLQTQAQGLSRNNAVLQGETFSYAEQLRSLQGQTSESVLDQALFFNREYDDLSRLRSGIARSDRATFSVVGDTGQTNFVVTSGYDRSDFGFERTQSYIVGSSLEHDLSRSINLYARGNYQYTTTTLIDCLAALAVDPQTAGLSDAALQLLCQNPSDFEGAAHTVSILGGISRDIFRNAEAFAEISRTQRFADENIDEYMENALTVGLTFKF
ncbi:MAG: hypothetical protein ACWA5L_01950 [bacterium]